MKPFKTQKGNDVPDEEKSQKKTLFEKILLVMKEIDNVLFPFKEVLQSALNRIKNPILLFVIVVIFLLIGFSIYAANIGAFKFCFTVVIIFFLTIVSLMFVCPWTQPILYVIFILIINYFLQEKQKH